MIDFGFEIWDLKWIGSEISGPIFVWQFDSRFTSISSQHQIQLNEGDYAASVQEKWCTKLTISQLLEGKTKQSTKTRLVISQQEMVSKACTMSMMMKTSCCMQNKSVSHWPSSSTLFQSTTRPQSTWWIFASCGFNPNYFFVIMNSKVAVPVLVSHSETAQETHRSCNQTRCDLWKSAKSRACRQSKGHRAWFRDRS